MNNLQTKKKIEYDGFVFNRSDGHYRRSAPCSENPERWLHRYVWHKLKGPIPVGFVIHHVDEDKSNNDLTNLQLKTFEAHVKDHAKNNKTDNSHLVEKVKLRLDTLLLIDKSEINILEAFAGDGFIWNEVRKQTDKKLNILRIDEKPDKIGIYLKGNNLKFMKGIDVQYFDIIDLDAYGSPFRQLEILFEKKYKGIVHCTFIQSGMGMIDYKLLVKLGYLPEMIKKSPTLFSRNGLYKFEQYLALNGIKTIIGYFIDRKNYFYFTTTV